MASGLRIGLNEGLPSRSIGTSRPSRRRLVVTQTPIRGPGPSRWLGASTAMESPPGTALSAARTTPAMSHQSHWSRRAPESRAVASSRSETNRARRADSEAMLVRKRSVVAASNDTSDWHRLEA